MTFKLYADGLTETNEEAKCRDWANKQNYTLIRLVNEQISKVGAACPCSEKQIEKDTRYYYLNTTGRYYRIENGFYLRYGAVVSITL